MAGDPTPRKTVVAVRRGVARFVGMFLFV